MDQNQRPMTTEKNNLGLNVIVEILTQIGDGTIWDHVGIKSFKTNKKVSSCTPLFYKENANQSS